MNQSVSIKRDCRGRVKSNFINFCQIFAMKLNVSEGITSLGLNDKTIALSQTNMSPGRYN